MASVICKNCGYDLDKTDLSCPDCGKQNYKGHVSLKQFMHWVFTLTLIGGYSYFSTSNDHGKPVVANPQISAGRPVMEAAKDQSLSFDVIKNAVYIRNLQAEFKASDAYDDAPSGYKVQFSGGVMRVTSGETKMMETRATTVTTFDMRCLGESRNLLGSTIAFYICEAANNLSVPARSSSGTRYQFDAKKGSVFFLSGDVGEVGNKYNPPSFYHIFL